MIATAAPFASLHANVLRAANCQIIGYMSLRVYPEFPRYTRSSSRHLYCCIKRAKSSRVREDLGAYFKRVREDFGCVFPRVRDDLGAYFGAALATVRS